MSYTGLQMIGIYFLGCTMTGIITALIDIRKRKQMLRKINLNDNYLIGKFMEFIRLMGMVSGMDVRAPLREFHELKKEVD